MGPAELTESIRCQARTLGLDALGVAPVSALPQDRLQTWLQQGFQGEMAWMERHTEKRLDPRKILPDAQSVISAALNYYHPYPLPYDRPRQGVISRYASGDDYHQVLESRLRQLLEFIQKQDPGAQGKVYVDTGPVLDKYWAAASGIGWLGKHTNVLNRSLGSWFFLGEILLNRRLEYDVPGPDHCGSCRRCIDACPTGAIVQPYVLDSRRCISYLTIELRSDLPEEFRPAMGNLVYGCDICQDVCPWNRKAKPSSVSELAPRPAHRSPSLRSLARLSPQAFRDTFRNSPIRRAKWRGLMRNVAVAMGNSRDPSLVGELKRLLQVEDAMVRRHAAWALAQIATEEAWQALQERQKRETDELTARTLTDLLARRESPGRSAAPPGKVKSPG